MPHYLVELREECGETGCTRRAEVELRNGRNERVGRYCRPHGRRRLAAALTDESPTSPRRSPRWVDRERKRP